MGTETVVRSPIRIVEGEEGRADQEEPGDGVVPAQMLAEVEGDEDGEDDRVMTS